MDWFINDRDLRHERGKPSCTNILISTNAEEYRRAFTELGTLTQSGFTQNPVFNSKPKTRLSSLCMDQNKTLKNISKIEMFLTLWSLLIKRLLQGQQATTRRQITFDPLVSRNSWYSVW